MNKTKFIFFPCEFFHIFWRQFFCNTVKGRKICKLTKTATETCWSFAALGAPVMEVDLVDIDITVMQYECLLFVTVSAFINCKCTVYTASQGTVYTHFVKECGSPMFLAQVKGPVYRKFCLSKLCAQ